MAESVQIQTLTPRHDAIITFLVANPAMKKGDVARRFGVSPAWLSTVINSDVFQAKLRERQDEFFSAATESTREKLSRLANETLDKLIEKVEVETETSEIRAMATLALDRLGYNAFGGPGQALAGAGGNVQNNFFIGVERDTLARARERIFNRQGNQAIEGETVSREAPDLTPTAGIPASDSNPMGEALEVSAIVYQGDKTPGTEGAR
jgi:hypothetical protein